MKESIKRLIPYMEENFITFPLKDEGVYLPSVNIGFLIAVDQKLTYDDFHVLEDFVDKPGNVVIFVNSEILLRRKKKYYVSFGISYVDDTKRRDIHLETLYKVAYSVIKKFKK